jgi:hypothetical protein
MTGLPPGRHPSARESCWALRSYGTVTGVVFMSSNTSRARTWVVCLSRGTALLLLLTCVDMLSPQTCAEELFGFPAAVLAKAAAAERGASPGAGVVSESSHTGEDSESDHPDEDCFCCCAHLIVRAHFRLESEPPASVVCRPEWLSLPVSPPHPLYHPPRTR